MAEMVMGEELISGPDGGGVASPGSVGVSVGGTALEVVTPAAVGPTARALVSATVDDVPSLLHTGMQGLSAGEGNGSRRHVHRDGSRSCGGYAPRRPPTAKDLRMRGTAGSTSAAPERAAGFQSRR